MAHKLDLEKVRLLYEQDMLSCQEIADRMGVSRESIRRRLVSMGIKPQRTGRRNGRYNEGRWQNGAGYWMVREPNGTEQYEHRIVAEKMLGRPLRPEETVHHINHQKDDNRPENLLVVTHSEHMKIHARDRRLGIPET